MIKLNRKPIKAVLFGIVFLLLAGIVSAIVYQYYGSDLSSGTYEDTLYNTTGSFVHLNFTDATNTSYVSAGNYTSDIINFGETTGFTEIKWQGRQGSCPENMSYIDKFGGYCIDQYEAYNAGSSIAGSAPGTTAWVSVSQTNAKIYCANAGKHLCSSLEWLGAANIQGQVYNLPGDLIVAPYYCNTGSSAKNPTGSSPGCVSAEGVYDMVGNVWEWVNETVDTIKPSTCSPASSGYCYANSTGSFVASTSASTDKYGDDSVYFLANTASGRAVRRGGDWADEAVAGPFAVRLYDAPADTNTRVGFRCCSGSS